MEIIRQKEVHTVTPIQGVTIHEYETADAFISGAVAEIQGRYPAHGFCMNQRIKELVYVIAGQGVLVLKDRSVSFAAGDTLFIEQGEAFAWEGQMTLYIATTPKFDPAQHVDVA